MDDKYKFSDKEMEELLSEVQEHENESQLKILEEYKLLELCKRFTDDSTKAMNSTVIFNILKRNKIKTIEDLKGAHKHKIILFHGVGMKRLGIIMQMKKYLEENK